MTASSRPKRSIHRAPRGSIRRNLGAGLALAAAAEAVLAVGGPGDCDGNGVQDAEEIIVFPDAATVTVSQVPGSPPAAVFGGPPDNVTAGLGESGVVTYDFGTDAIVDIVGPDFNIYENEFGNAEFQIIAVEVSADGMTFTDISDSARPVVPIPGDLGQLTHARSYDIRTSGQFAVGIVRITAIPGGGGDGMDLDAIGILHGLDCDENMVLDSCDIDVDPMLDVNGNGIIDSCEPPVCPGDTNGDGLTDVDDLVNVILDFGTDGFLHNGDRDGNGVVNIDDIVIVIVNFGGDCFCITC
jgi:hypothetical protein